MLCCFLYDDDINKPLCPPQTQRMVLSSANGYSCLGMHVLLCQVFILGMQPHGHHWCISHFCIFFFFYFFRSSTFLVLLMLTKRNVISYVSHYLGGIQTWRIQNCRGQHRQIFHPHLQNGDPLLVVNICKYFWHSLYSSSSWYGEQPRNHSLIPSRSKEFSCLRVQTDPGDHEGYCLVGSWGSFSKAKAAGASNWPCTSIWC
jgi:hypothetical protein